MKKVFDQFNLLAQAKKAGIPLWQLPQFLFLVMGLIIIVSTIVSYILGVRYIGDPMISLLIIFGLVTVQMIISFIVTQSFENLVAATRLKSEFVSIVSHQLRSPLTNLKWGLDFLMAPEHRSGENEWNAYLQILKENTARMHELINDLLTVSRVQEGRLSFKKTEFSFEELIENIVREFQSLIRASNIEVKVEDEKAPPVFGDSSQIRQVVANLLDNAIRYSWKEVGEGASERKEKNRITIRYRPQGKELYVEVQDNGIGIPSEDQKYIFEKFFRSKNVIPHQTQGSGLGLYIVKSLVEKSGGKIGFTSEENKGSTFWFTLPLSKGGESNNKSA